MNVDVFVQGMLAGFLIGLFIGAGSVIEDLYGGELPPLRQIGRDLVAVRALLAINRSADWARQQLLEEARRHVPRGKA